MNCIIVSYGSAGWSEKRRFIERLIASRPGPPFMYNDVLILVSSSRMKRMYGRLFLDIVLHKGSSALVQPEVQTLHHFFEKRYSSLKGPRLMDENSRLILLEGLVKERLINSSLFSQSPDLLAPSLSAAIAASWALGDVGVAPPAAASLANTAVATATTKIQLARTIGNPPGGLAFAGDPSGIAFEIGAVDRPSPRAARKESGS